MLQYINYLTILFLISNVQYTDGAIAAMSVDLGSQFMKIGVVKIGIPLEIVLNKESQRKTPTIIGFHNGERLFGETALQMSYKNPERVFTYITDLLGKQFDNPVVEDYMKQFPYHSLTADPERGTVVFNTKNDGSYSVETLVGMILWNAREQVIAFSKTPLKDVVITCPAYFNQAEREALAKAAEIAGMNLLQLISDGAGAGVNYAFTRRKEITKESQNMLIYDIGASKTIATVVELKLGNVNKSKTNDPIVTVQGVGYNRLLGGHDLTLRVRDFLASEFTKQHKTSKPIYGNLRAMAKLTKEAERVKHVLSANLQTYAQVESLFEDKDFRYLMHRDSLIEILKEFEQGYLTPVEDALRMAETNVESINQVVLFGAGTRIPFIQDLLRNRFGKEPSKFLNTDEASALGALYQAAHLSKGFKVKKIVVQELQLYPININFETLTEEKTLRPIERTIFGYKSLYPTNRKIMTFTSYTSDFTVNLHYGSIQHLSKEQLSEFGELNITDVQIDGVTDAVKTATEDEVDYKGVKVYFSIDYYGIVRTEGAEAIIEKHPVKANSTLGAIVDTLGSLFSSKEPEPSEGIKDDTDAVKPPDSKSGDEDEKEEKSEQKEKTEDKKEESNETKQGNQTETEQPTADTASSNTTTTTTNATAPVNATDTKPKVIKKKLDVSLYQLRPPLDDAHIKETKKVLSQFEKQEREKAEREAAHNELEAKIYDIQDRLNQDEFLKFTRGEETTKLGELVSETSKWLEDDVDINTKTEDFIEKRTAIDAIFKPIMKRIKGFEMRPKLIEKYNDSLVKLNELVNKLKTDTPDLFEPSFYKKSEEMIVEMNEFIEKRLPGGKAADDDDTINDDLKKKTKDMERVTGNLFSEFTKKMREITAKKAAEEAAAKAKQNTTNTTTPEEGETPEPSKDSEAPESSKTSEEETETVNDSEKNAEDEKVTEAKEKEEGKKGEVHDEM